MGRVLEAHRARRAEHEPAAGTVGAVCLEKEHQGKGILLGGVPGVRRGRIVILGGGVVGTQAAKVAVGIGAEVTLLDINLSRLAYLDDIFGGAITTMFSFRPFVVRRPPVQVPAITLRTSST